jgi:hypothetical protein
MSGVLVVVRSRWWPGQHYASTATTGLAKPEKWHCRTDPPIRSKHRRSHIRVNPRPVHGCNGRVTGGWRSFLPGLASSRLLMISGYRFAPDRERLWSRVDATGPLGRWTLPPQKPAKATGQNPVGTVGLIFRDKISAGSTGSHHRVSGLSSYPSKHSPLSGPHRQ